MTGHLTAWHQHSRTHPQSDSHNNRPERHDWPPHREASTHTYSVRRVHAIIIVLRDMNGHLTLRGINTDSSAEFTK